MNENPAQPSQSNEKPIEPLKLKAVNGFRARLNAVLKRVGLSVGAGIIAGSLAGSAVQNVYRDITGYDPDNTEEGETEPIAPEDEKAPQEKGGGIIPASIRKKLEEVKEFVSTKVSKTEILDKYNEVIKIYQNIPEAIDSAAFWGTFALAFLAATLLAGKLMDIKKDLTEAVDPAVVASLKEIQNKMNEIVEKMNAQGTVSEDMKRDMIQMQKRFEGMDIQ